MAGSAGSLDDLEDAIQCLERDGCAFLLLVGRPGEPWTRLWSRNRGNLGPETHGVIRDAVEAYLSTHWDDPDEPAQG